MDYIESAIRAFRRIGLKGANSCLEPLLSCGKGELFVLNYLYFKKAAVTPSQLGAALGSSSARISAILNALERKREVSREIDRVNRNHILVTLTDAGRARANGVAAALDQTMAAVFGEMGEADTLEFLRLANRFLDALTQRPLEEQRKGG